VAAWADVGRPVAVTVQFCEGLGGEDSIHALLHWECFNLFPDETFGDLFTDVGRLARKVTRDRAISTMVRIPGTGTRPRPVRYKGGIWLSTRTARDHHRDAGDRGQRRRRGRRRRLPRRGPAPWTPWRTWGGTRAGASHWAGQLDLLDALLRVKVPCSSSIRMVDIRTVQMVCVDPGFDALEQGRCPGGRSSNSVWDTGRRYRLSRSTLSSDSSGSDRRHARLTQVGPARHRLSSLQNVLSSPAPPGKSIR